MDFNIFNFIFLDNKILLMIVIFILVVTNLTTYKKLLKLRKVKKFEITEDMYGEDFIDIIETDFYQKEKIRFNLICCGIINEREIKKEHGEETIDLIFDKVYEEIKKAFSSYHKYIIKNQSNNLLIYLETTKKEAETEKIKEHLNYVLNKFSGQIMVEGVLDMLEVELSFGISLNQDQKFKLQQEESYQAFFYSKTIEPRIAFNQELYIKS